MRAAIAAITALVCLSAQAAEPVKPVKDPGPPAGYTCRHISEADCMARLDKQMKAMDELHQRMMQAPPEELRGMMRDQMGMMRHMMRMMSDQVRNAPPKPAKDK